MGLSTWLGIFGWGSPPPEPPPAPGTADAVGAAVVEFYLPGHVYAGEIERYLSFEAEQVEFNLGTGTIEIDGTEPVLALTYDRAGSSHQVRDLPYNCGVIIRYRDGTFLDAIVEDWEDEDDEERAGSPGEIPTKVTWHLRQTDAFLLSKRMVKGTDGGRYTQENVPPDDAARALLRANTQAPGGGGIEPTWYALNGVDREDFGPYTVTIPSDSSSHPDTDPRVRWHHNEPLLGSLLEYCRRWGMRLSGSWGTGGERVIDVVYPLTGADPARPVVFDRERGTLKRFKLIGNGGREANVAETTGKGSRETQARAFAQSETSRDLFGVIETGEGDPSADAADAQNNADFVIAQVSGTERRYEARIVEGDGCIWNTNFVLSDKVKIYCSARNVVAHDWITKLRLTRTVPEPPDLEIHTGRADDNEDQKSQRSGGGGSGSRRAGGKPKRKTGEPDTVRLIEPDVGSDVVFDQVDDELYLHGEANDRIRARIFGADGGDDEETQEELEVQIIADFFGPCPVCNGYVKVLDRATGREIHLLAKLSDVGVTPPNGGL